MQKINLWYLRKGYITTRVYLQAQSLKHHILRLRILEGTVEAIKLEDNGKKSIFLPTLFPGVVGSLLNLRTLEQAIDQVNRLPSNNAVFGIVPGSKPGKSVVIVKNKPKRRFRVNFDLNNHGASSAGKIQGAVTVSLDNLLGLNDLITYTHRQSIPHLWINRNGESSSDTVSLIVPVGYFTYTLGFGRSKYKSIFFTSNGTSFISSGVSDVTTFRVDRLMYRDKYTKFSLFGETSVTRRKNYLNGSFLDISSKDKTKLSLGFIWQTSLFRNPFKLNLSYNQGLPLFGAASDTSNLPGSAPRNEFRKINANLSYGMPISFINKRLRWSTRMSGQYAFDSLYSDEKFYIGGIYSVRGFVDNSLSGDNGYYWRNEISYLFPLRLASAVIPVKIYSAFDVGCVGDRVPDKYKFYGWLAGTAYGVSLMWKKIGIDVFQSRAVRLLSHMEREGTQTWFRLSYSI